MSEGVSIIIPTFNGKKLLKEYLPFVLEELARYKEGGEVIVVDDAGGDGTAEDLPAMFPAVRVIKREKNGGFAKTVNTGVRAAGYPYIFLLNNDIKITPGILEKLSACLRAKDVFAVQAKIVTDIADEDNDHLGVFSSRAGLFKYEYKRTKLNAGETAEMDFASGGASMFSRDKFLALGLFDERFSPFYFEDMDISFRARWFGWRILYQPAAKVYHLHAGSTVKALYPVFKYRVIHKRNYFLFLLKNTVKLRTVPVFMFYAVYRIFTGGLAELAGFLRAAWAYLFAARRVPEVQPPNILYLDTPLPQPGGGQISLLNILKNLKGYNPFVVLCGQSEIVNEFRTNGIPYRVIKAEKKDVFGFIPVMIRVLSSVRPHIIHCNSGTAFSSFVFAAAAKLRGIPFVWHNRILETAGWKEKAIAALSSRVIVISEAVGRKFKWLPPEKVVKLHNAVDLDGFKEFSTLQYLYKEFKLDRRIRMVGIFSRLDKWKGHELFLAAAKKALSKTPDCMFLIAGEGPERNRLESMVHGFDMDGKVLFAGHRQDIAALMNLCAVIVNPSILPEPFGRTIIEGMACGKPVIATAMGGPLEIIEDKVDGFLTAPDPDAIAGVICKLLDNPAYAAKIGANARKKAELCFDLRTQMARLAEIYKVL